MISTTCPTASMVTPSGWNDLSRVGIGVTRPHRSLLIGFSLYYSA
jgi:hypothetical protein